MNVTKKKCLWLKLKNHYTLIVISIGDIKGGNKGEPFNYIFNSFYSRFKMMTAK